MSRKPRADSKLFTMPEEQQLEIFLLLKNGMSYRKARLYLQRELGVSVSLAALSHAWETWSRQAAKDHALKTVAACKAINSQAATLLPGMDTATESILQTAAFNAVSAEDPETAKLYLGMYMDLLKAKTDTRKLEQAERKLELLEKKAAAMDKVEETVKSESLSPLEQANLMRGLFNMPPLEEPA